MSETELAKVETTEGVEVQAAMSVPPVASVAPVPPQPGMQRIEEHTQWPLLSQMTVAATAGIPLSGFKVRDLLRLEAGNVVESAWPHTEDVLLEAGRVHVAWSEFEVADQKLVVRLTRLA